MLSTPIGRFRLLALAEAVSWIGLLIGMFFKYVVVQNEIGVQIFGPIHGAIFVGYVIVTLAVRTTQRWGTRTTFLALLASIPPFGTVVFERWASKHGKLDLQASTA
jgi:integral membrane protein